MIRAALLAIAIVFVGLAPGPAIPSAAAQQSAGEAVARERQQLLQRLERLRQSTADARSRAATLGEELVDLASDEAKLRERAEETAERVGALEQEVAAGEEALERLTDDLAAIRHDLAQKRTELSSILMALQRIGRRPPPALFGDTGDATQTVRGAILLNAVLPELDEDARALTATLARASQLEAEERAQWARLSTDLAALNAERRRLEELTGELQRRRALSLYERERATADIARLVEEEATVADLIDRLTREGVVPRAQNLRSFESRRGSLTQPVAGAVVSTFGEETETGDVAQGRTIAALPRATVFAPMAGTVLFSSPFSDYGHVLILDAGEGYHMVFAGMEESSVNAGDRVDVGTPLGRMGQGSRRSASVSTSVKGSALLGSRPALYVELRKDRVAVDSQGWWRVASADSGRTG